jgi:cysteine-rich repeat protein
MTIAPASPGTRFDRRVIYVGAIIGSTLLATGGYLRYGITQACGNGMVEGTEACDDGATTAGDGCSATCTVETDYACSGTPSVCSVPNALAGSHPAWDWYIVPGGMGGTTSLQWLPAHGQTTSLMGELESRLTASALGTAEIVGIDVYHGEAECNSAVEATRWPYRWAYGCEELRTTIGDRDIPCMFTQLPVTTAATCNSTVWAQLRAAQATLPRPMVRI